MITCRHIQITGHILDRRELHRELTYILITAINQLIEAV